MKSKYSLLPDTFALTRLSLGFSKKIEHHANMVALYTVRYNFIKMHKTVVSQFEILNTIATSP